MPDQKKMHSHLTHNLELDWSGKEPPTDIDGDACLPAREVYRRDRRVQHQLWFMLALGVFMFLVVAVRAELNQRDLDRQQDVFRQAVYVSCVRRAEIAITYNQGRDALIQFITTRQRDQSEEAIALTTEQLRTGLLLPVESCPPPIPATN